VVKDDAQYDTFVNMQKFYNYKCEKSIDILCKIIKLYVIKLIDLSIFSSMLQGATLVKMIELVYMKVSSRFAY